MPQTAAGHRERVSRRPTAENVRLAQTVTRVVNDLAATTKRWREGPHESRVMDGPWARARAQCADEVDAVLQACLQS